MLPNDIVIADTQTRQRAAEFQIHRRVTDDTTGVKAVVRANDRDAGEVNVRPDDAVRADFHAFVNHDIRPDANRGIQPGFRMNDGGWVNYVPTMGEKGWIAKLKTILRRQ